VDKIGHLCDYILFDSAWVGYEQFIPMMADCSPPLFYQSVMLNVENSMK
jgi:arginine/lysine/ornithine decarboxylase